MLLDLGAQQGAWWATVLLVGHGLGASAALPSLLVVAMAVWARGRATLILAALAAGLGFVVDTVLVQLAAVSFPAQTGTQLTTGWMVGLWAAFGTSFTGSLAWLRARGAAFAAAIGCAGGLFAYRAGAGLGALAIDDGAEAALFICAGWALAITLLRLAALRLLPAAQQARS